MPKIYRVELRGKGVYGAIGYDEIHNQSSSVNRIKHPAPWNDPGISDAWDDLADDYDLWFFGFTSLKQYRNWFNSKVVRTDLAARGCTLCIYEVAEEFLRKSKKQCIFLKSEASKIDAISTVTRAG